MSLGLAQLLQAAWLDEYRFNSQSRANVSMFSRGRSLDLGACGGKRAEAGSEYGELACFGLGSGTDAPKRRCTALRRYGQISMGVPAGAWN